MGSWDCLQMFGTFPGTFHADLGSFWSVEDRSERLQILICISYYEIVSYCLWPVLVCFSIISCCFWIVQGCSRTILSHFWLLVDRFRLLQDYSGCSRTCLGCFRTYLTGFLSILGYLWPDPGPFGNVLWVLATPLQSFAHGLFISGLFLGGFSASPSS